MNKIIKFNEWVNESLRDKMTPVSEDDVKRKIGEHDYKIITNFKEEIKKLEEKFDEIVDSNVYLNPFSRPPLNNVGELFSNRYNYIIEYNRSKKGRWRLQISIRYKSPIDHPIPFFSSNYKDWDSLIDNLKEQINKFK